ncbi:MAG: phage tail tape measure protein [Actinomycetales bacterium]|nr:phage tail tape measure protein [Actinomycetales bacterium]
MTDPSPVKLRADVSNYLAGMEQAGSATREFSSRAGEGVAKHKADWAQVGQSVTVAGLAIAAGVGLAVSRFADFDQAMSAASAATRATSRDLAALREAAMQAGADTQYSATEAAQAITELGKAGLSTSEILGGGPDRGPLPRCGWANGRRQGGRTVCGRYEAVWARRGQGWARRGFARGRCW